MRRQPLRTLIADDHDLFADGLAVLLADHAEIAVVGRAADGAEAVALAALLRPDVVLMDVEMPRLDGIQATRTIIDARPETRVVVVSAVRDAETAGRARCAGAAAYVFKGCPVADLVAAVLEVAASPPAACAA
jgi:DNA-binding NarL/FixJ family response regulator